MGARENYSSRLNSAVLGLSFDDVLLIPQYSNVRLCDIDTSTWIINNLKLKIPIISSPMDTVTGFEMALALARLGGLGILPRNMSLEETLKTIRAAHEEKLPTGIAVGPFDDEKVARAAEEGVDIVVIDTAHGHSYNVIEATKRFKRDYDVDLMVGNIATPEGGIEKPADIVKALAVGADAVMLGYLLAGTNEAPGEVLQISGRLYKKYRGMGSRSALESGSARYGEFKKVPEGVEGYVEHRGSLSKVIDYLVGGLKQGMGYLGARSIKELRVKARFVKITSAGARESHPRGFYKVEE